MRNTNKAKTKVQARVREIIERARKEQSKEINLSSYQLPGQLEEIPDEVFDLHQLESLNLSANRIREVSERVRELPNLKRLDIRLNPIEKVPDTPGLSLDWDAYVRCRKRLSRQNIEGILVELNYKESLKPKKATEPYLGQELALLPGLRTLDVINSRYTADKGIPRSAEQVRDLLENLANLHNLEMLSIYDVLLQDLPNEILELKKLERLSFYRAGLQEIPEWVGRIRSLHYLGLQSNELTSLPASLSNLSELQTIDLSNNPFSEIPDVVFQMKNLTHVNIANYEKPDSEGGIRQVLSKILHLEKLESFSVYGQPIEVPPPEVVKQGVEAIKNYWRQQQETGIDYLCEAKLIIIGEPGAGKTSLAKKIDDPNYQLETQEPSTEGIDIIRWSFPAAVRINRDGREELHQTDFKVSIWDFGGQEIYKATHQFFLTRRSLYALVADDRKEDTDFNYWLQVVELLSDQSPLLIVQNEKQDRQRGMDFASLRANFPNLREAFQTNLATNRGLEKLRAAIRQELERLPHIGTPLPKTWSQVRTALENDSRNYISLDQYLTICQENGFTRGEDKLQLSGYLHDLGICLHFQDDPVLKNTVILKPKWGTDAVYNVLDDRTVRDRKGKFGKRDLARIWSDEKYSTMRDELLRLMMRFQLCYQLPETEDYIAPQLLSPTRPIYEWDGRNELVLRYDYDFMPRGIITRFIVAVNHLIADQSLVWKSGVILAREGTRAEVIEDYPRRKITVRVSGADTRSLLAIVDDQLERIHTSFRRLKLEKFLPCNCEVCQARDEPFAYPLSELKDFASQGDKIQCRVSRKLVDAALLIRDVLPSAAYVPEGLIYHAAIFREERGPKPEPAPTKEVFVSYSWTDESTSIVDKIEEALKGRDIVLIRDKNEIAYKDSIRAFMQRIGRGKSIVVILSKKYLESKNCMFEMTEIAARGDMRDRVFPIVLDDANIYDALGRLHYIKYWEQKIEELDAAMKEVSAAHLQGIREELDLFTNIRATAAHIVDILGDMNSLSPEQHRGSNFGSLLLALEARLAG